MLAGHIKSSCDRSFGVLKKSYRDRFASSLYNVVDAVEASSNNGTNVVELVGLPDGTVWSI